MKKITKNKGLIIKTMDYKENAVIATIFTDSKKVSCIIKGAKKLNSSTRRIAQPLTLIDFNYTESNSLGVLTEAVVLDNYTSLKEDLDKYYIVLSVLEKLNYFLDQITDYPTLFNFILEILELMKNKNYDKILSLIFEVKLLYLLGVSPSFKSCPLCNKAILNGALLISSGGFICDDCIKKRTPSLTKEESSFLKLLYKTKIKDLSDEIISKELEYPKIYDVIDEYYAYHLDFESKVKKIIKKIG